MKKKEVYITHVMFPWETFADAKIREEREMQNDGERWTEEFRGVVRGNIERYAVMEDEALRNSCLNDVYGLIPFHLRAELFKGIVFPIWSEKRALT